MENRLIEVEDLQVGDEIMISCQSCFKYLRVVAPPQLGKGTVYRTNKPMYKNVRCTTRQDVVTIQYQGWNGGNGYTRDEKTWVITPDDHNLRVSQDLNHRQIWLVKRETI